MAMTEAPKSPCLPISWPVTMAFLILLSLPVSQQLQSSQTQTLLRLQKLLEFPKAMDGLSNATDFCKLSPSSSLTVVCNGNTITQLQIVGDKPSPSITKLKKNVFFSVSNQTLSPAFSVDSFFTTLTKLYSLKSVCLVSLGIWGSLPSKLDRLSSLEILNISSNFLYGTIPQQLSSMRNIRTFILDNNMVNGTVPDWFSALPSLALLSLKNNWLTGNLPPSFSSMQALRVLVLSGNNLSGNVPDLSASENLQVLNLEGNRLGPEFPMLGRRLVVLVLSKNKFRCQLPLYLGTFKQLQYLDISFNALVGLPLPSLFSLPATRYLNLAGNALDGSLPRNLSCSASLGFVDLSSNFMTGKLPSCLISNSSKRAVKFGRNCLATKLQPQHNSSYCKHTPVPKKTPRTHKIAIVIGIVGGIVVLLALVLLLLVLLRRSKYKKAIKKYPPGKLAPENASTGISSDILANARYISQTMKLGAHGLPHYRPFALEELEEATNNFNQSAFLGEGSHGKLYRGRLEDGTLVAIRCLKLERKQSIQNLKLHLELLSKLRHQHLVSLLGHCIDYAQDGSTVKRVFLIFEYVSNGTLKSHLSGNMPEEGLMWPQRLATVSGVARAIHFLHTGVVPSIFHNNLKITNILLDQNHIAKVSDYGLPISTEDIIEFEAKVESHKVAQNESIFLGRRKLTDKVDIYNFGLILLETIIGRSPTIQGQGEDKVHEMVNLVSDQDSRRLVVDPAIISTCVEESLATVIAITAKCISKDPVDRPSMEDVLWNLQYAAQVQDTSVGNLEGNEKT
eukprot:Gb_33904 [translate_table: standard]